MSDQPAPRLQSAESPPPQGVTAAVGVFLASRRADSDWDDRLEALAATAELVASKLFEEVNPQLVRELRLLLDDLAGGEGEDAFDRLAAELSASVGNSSD